MSMAPVQTHDTPEELLDLRDQHGYEWIDGQLVEKNMGAQSGRVVQIVNRHIDVYAETHQLGLVFPPDTGYRIFANKPKRVRKPDGSFIRRGRLPDDKPPRGYILIPPDLVIEGISPNDLAEDIDERVTDFLSAGTKLMWVFYPSTRTVYVLRQGTGMSCLTAADELSGEDVLPGFACRVEELFAGI